MDVGLVGALIGGGFALAGSLLSHFLQARHSEKCLARALLIEMVSSLTPDEIQNTDNFYLDQLDQWIADGQITNRDSLRRLLSPQAGERYPVYSSNLAAIGSLPAAISSPLVRFHAVTNGLIFHGRFLIESEHMSEEDVKTIAHALKQKYLEMQATRLKALDALRDAAGWRWFAWLRPSQAQLPAARPA